METKDDSLESKTISALLSFSKTAKNSQIQNLLPKFSNPLKINFENRNLWLRFGLTLSLSRESPRSALEAFNECQRIDQNDPLPAMLAARVLLEDLDDPNGGLKLIHEAIERCQKLLKQTNKDSVNQLLAKCYLLASIMYAHIYDREPESIKQFNISNLNNSLKFLNLATETYTNDYLIHFHKALSEARYQKSYSSAIDSLREAIKLNPHHVPSMQLFILSLSALKLYNEALILCESTLHEFEDNLLLLYIKCNLEQCLVETRGFKSALNTAQHILKCIRRSFITKNKRQKSNVSNRNGLDSSQAIPTIAVTSTTSSSLTTATTAISSTTVSTTTNTLTSPTIIATIDSSKQSTNLFAEDDNQIKYSKSQLFTHGELTAWLLVAEIFIKLGSVNDAELCVDEGSSHADGALSYQIMYIRGLIAKARDNLLEAKNFFQSCLALYPKHPEALQQIAHVHYLLGSHSIAEKFLKDSLDLNSECHKTWHYLSLVFIETNQHEKANDCMKKANLLEETLPIVNISVIPRLTLE